ncbi:MAG: hypothetical protein AAGD07_20970 [Planctomycetota bacterium]
MSDSPNPFQRPPAGGNDPLRAELAGEPVKKKSRLWLWILVIVLGVGALSVALCCGGGYYAATQLSGMVFVPAVNQIPEVQQEVGTVESMAIDFGATVEVAEDNPDFVVFEMQGTKGSGKIAIKPGNEGEIGEAFLIRQDGTRVTLSTGGGPSTSLPPEPLEPAPLEFETELDPTDAQLQELESALDIGQ